ncbi:MAG TPA: twin-arginine translocation signal domain-containing protein [Streptosporangiaceae bacterium]|nr:twin-arginine translocation signal domain-containing protein [Streptosporangiaceae bacterium]
MLGVSRREFLGGAAGVAAAVALPPSRNSRTATAPLVGATVDLHSYAGVTNYVQAANILDGYVGMPLATTIQKFLLTSSVFPTSVDPKLTQLSPDGCQFVVSVMPSTTLTSSAQTALSNYLAMLTKAGINYRVLLFSEANDTAFTSQQTWQAYWSYYAPVIKDAGVSCAYCPGCNGQSIGRAEAFFPSNPTPDELWLDYYATALRGGVKIDKMIALAKAAGISVGLAEWGWHAGKSFLAPMTMPWWTLYCNYLAHLAASGSFGLGAIYFDDSPGPHPVNAIGATNDPRIPGIKKVFSAIQTAR